jgi:hypothetical protein
VRSTKSVPDATGYILYESQNIAVIVTIESENTKTGNMEQIWILVRNESPVSAVKSGNDDLVCMDCKHRGEDGFKNRVCYVNVAQGPNSVWDAYQAGSYPRLRKRDYPQIFADREVRFGAYGDPVLIPLTIVRAITQTCKAWTGYTHQWTKPQYQMYRYYLMASVDSLNEYASAKRLGWRTYRTRKDASVPLLPHEIMCPASDEFFALRGKKIQCINCKLCSGNHKRMRDVKDAVIIVHGSQAKNFVSLDSIAMAS